MNILKLIIPTMFFCSLSIAALGQGNTVYRDYIEKFKDIAIEEMNQYQIPASITLAQGLLESGAGKSELATKANNHFGIKCSSDWTGPYVLKDDDYKNEKFRVYKNARDSYEDHSLFLRNRPRYAALFSLDRKDYVGWAHGLKSAGYATNPRYAYLLINIIETYGLHLYDDHKGEKRLSKSDQKFQKLAQDDQIHSIRRCNDNYYLIARSGDTFKSLSKETGVSYRKLARYNELDKNYKIAEGDIIYLEKKRTKADKVYSKHLHTSQAGESMYSIAQMYGIRLKSLYKINHLPPDYQLRAGDTLKLR